MGESVMDVTEQSILQTSGAGRDGGELKRMESFMAAGLLLNAGIVRGVTLAEAGGMKAMKGESQCTAGSHVTGDAGLLRECVDAVRDAAKRSAARQRRDRHTQTEESGSTRSAMQDNARRW